MNSVLEILRKGWRKPNWLSYFCLPISCFYQAVMLVRQCLYKMGMFSSTKLPVPVVVVGGISVGGVGKTPFVISLVEHFKKQGMQPGVISRGYQGQSDYWPRIVSASTNATIVGDEAQLIYARCEVPVVVGPKRVENAEYLLLQSECDVLISDDGFQHFALKREVDVVLIDGEYGLSNKWCLPAGPLRESITAINRASCIVINGKLEDKLPSKIATFTMNIKTQPLYCPDQSRFKDIAEFAHQTVHAVAALGNPSRFFKQLKSHGLKVIPHAFGDHVKLTAEDLRFDDQFPIVMTEKDSIKIQPLLHHKTFKERVWVVPIVAEIDADALQFITDLLKESVAR